MAACRQYIRASLPKSVAITLLLALCAHSGVASAQDENPFGEGSGYEEQRAITMLVANGVGGVPPIIKLAVFVDASERFSWQPRPRFELHHVAKLLGIGAWRLARLGPSAVPHPDIDVFEIVPNLDEKRLSTLQKRNYQPLARRLLAGYGEAVEHLYYLQAHSLANRTPIGHLQRHAKAREELQEVLDFTELFNAPASHQGKILSVEGRLVRVSALRAPQILKDQGIEHLYEAWLTNPETYGAGNLFCLHCTALPKGIQPQRSYATNHQVAFIGYFLKLRACENREPQFDPNRASFAPQIVGKMAATEPPKPEAIAKPEQKTFQTVQSLDKNALDDLKKRNRKPLVRFVPKIVQESVEATTYLQALSYAHRTPAGVFQNEVNNREATGEKIVFTHVFTQPEAHQGKIVQFNGELLRVTQFVAPKDLKKIGIEHLYEAWLGKLDDADPSQVVCLICTELPKGVEPRRSYDVRQRAAFVGYYFKLYAYNSESTKDDPKKARLAPLMIGQLVLQERPPVAAAESGFNFSTLGTLGVLVIVGMILVGALTWWTRRGDAAAQARIAAIRRRRDAAVVDRSEQTAGVSENEPPGLFGEDWPPANGESNNPDNPWNR